MLSGSLPPGALFQATRKRPARRESQLQKAIVEFHTAAVSDPLTAILFAVPNGERRDPTTAKRLTGISESHRAQLPDNQALLPFGQGVIPGVADLVLLTAAGVDFIELKTVAVGKDLFGQGAARAGSQGRYQKLFQAACERLGLRYQVVRSTEAYADLLEARGVALRCRPWGP